MNECGENFLIHDLCSLLIILIAYSFPLVLSVARTTWYYRKRSRYCAAFSLSHLALYAVLLCAILGVVTSLSLSLLPSLWFLLVSHSGTCRLNKCSQGFDEGYLSIGTFSQLSMELKVIHAFLLFLMHRENLSKELFERRLGGRRS